MIFAPLLFTGCTLRAICCRNFLRACSHEFDPGAVAHASTGGGSRRGSLLLRLACLGSEVDGDAPLRQRTKTVRRGGWVLAGAAPVGLAGGIPQPSSHRRATCAKQNHRNVGGVVEVGAEPDEKCRRCYPSAHARGSPRVRRALWTDLYRMRQRQRAG